MNLSIFYLLGFINNYSGGFSTENGTLQRISYLDFDYNLSPQKIKNCEKFIKMCTNTLIEFNNDNDIVIENWKKNDGMTINSKNLTKIIDDFCKSKSSFLGKDYFILDENIFEKLDWRNENSFSYQQRIKFLIGAVDNNAVENEFYFYNDYKKCLLIHNLLKCFADEDDEIIMKSYFRTPSTDRIAINKNGDIWKIINKYSS